jgi:hypothetical protein
VRTVPAPTVRNASRTFEEASSICRVWALARALPSLPFASSAFPGTFTFFSASDAAAGAVGSRCRATSRAYPIRYQRSSLFCIFLGPNVWLTSLG